ncbi:MAG: PIN domain-containing protein [Rhizomicrobium sp.]|jgi:predicted nucleic acid-binding protein
MHFLDTDILLYSISRDAAETRKRDIAIGLLDRDDGAVSIQVLQEFYVQATRDTRTDRISHDIAVGLMRTWMRFRVQDTTLSILNSALEIKSGFGLSYWDSVIVAAARALNCTQLYSEDLRHGLEIDGVTVTNPFR